MVNCQYCEESVAMPYTCSLCGNKFCGTHRLAESHDCENKEIYQTQEYRKSKIQKAREIERIKGGYYSTESSGSSVRGGGLPSLYSTWSHSNKYVTAFAGGLILGIAALISLLLGIGFSGLRIYDPLIIMLTGGLLFTITYEIRKQIAAGEGVSTEFLIRPVGIPITIITALFRFAFLVFGNFSNSMSDLRRDAKIGTLSIFSFAGMWFLIFLSSIFLSPYLSSGLRSGFSTLGFYFLFYGILMMIPWGFLDGAKIYQYNQRNYWMLLIFMISLFIIVLVL